MSLAASADQLKKDLRSSPGQPLPTFFANNNKLKTLKSLSSSYVRQRDISPCSNMWFILNLLRVAERNLTCLLVICLLWPRPQTRFNPHVDGQAMICPNRLAEWHFSRTWPNIFQAEVTFPLPMVLLLIELHVLTRESCTWWHGWIKVEELECHGPSFKYNF